MKIVVIVLVVNTLPLFLLNEYNLDIHSYPFFRYRYTSELPYIILLIVVIILGVARPVPPNNSG